jgi:rubrerythrin
MSAPLDSRMAAPELNGIEVGGVTRGAFILRGALAAGAVYGAGAVGPFVARAFGAVSTTDVQILGFALALENLEAAFYKAALARAGLTGKVKALATEFGAHEAEHVSAIDGLITALGGKSAAAAQGKFPLKNQAAFLQTAVTLEEIGISAYNGAVPSIQSPDLIAAAGSIVQVEARHAGALRMVAGLDPAPLAFDKPITPQATAARVRPFVKTGP